MWTPRPILDAWTPDQQRVAACFPACRRVAVPAANGVGKTFLAADLVVSFIQDMPAAAIIITAPTNRQVCELLWPHITDRLLQVGLTDAEWRIPTRPKWSGGDGDSLIGFATNTAQRMQGFHAEKLLIVCDEASGMPASLVEALEGIAVAEDNYILAIGNPNTSSGAFFEMTRRASYRVETISALTHPNILARREVVQGATTWRSMVDRVRDWCKEVEGSDQSSGIGDPLPAGEHFQLEISDRELGVGESDVPKLRTLSPNDAFRVRYLGQFPSAAAWALIPLHFIHRAMEVTLPGGRPKIAALDVARTGGDRTVYALRAGDTVVSMRVLRPAELTRQAQEVAAIMLHDEPEHITVDAAGVGYGLVDRLRELTSVNVVAFLGAEAPPGPSQAKRFFNRRAAAYGHLMEAFQAGRVGLPKDPELADELRSMTYRHTEDGRLLMDDKEKLRRTLGRSPDKADVISLLWEHRAVDDTVPNPAPRPVPIEMMPAPGWP